MTPTCPDGYKIMIVPVLIKDDFEGQSAISTPAYARGPEAQPTGMPGLTSASRTASRNPLTDNSKTGRHFCGCGSETGVGSPGYWGLRPVTETGVTSRCMDRLTPYISRFLHTYHRFHVRVC
jgi:hypothetical protein